MKKKTILVLQRVNFCFQNTWQSKDCIFRITCVGSLKKKSLIFKRSFQKRTSLISFRQTRLWSMRVDSRIERLSNKKNIDRVCKILDKNDINTSWHSLKSWPPGGNTVDPEKENKRYSDQLGAKKELNDELAKSIKVILGDHKSHLVIDRRMSMFRSTGGHVVQRQFMI